MSVVFKIGIPAHLIRRIRVRDRVGIRVRDRVRVRVRDRVRVRVCPNCAIRLTTVFYWYPDLENCPYVIGLQALVKGFQGLTASPI